MNPLTKSRTRPVLTKVQISMITPSTTNDDANRGVFTARPSLKPREDITQAA